MITHFITVLDECITMDQEVSEFLYEEYWSIQWPLIYHWVCLLPLREHFSFVTVKRVTEGHNDLLINYEIEI